MEKGNDRESATLPHLYPAFSCWAIPVLAALWVTGLTSPAYAAQNGFRLKAVWNAAGPQQELSSFTLNDLGRLKSSSSREKDVATGKLVQWKGVLLSHFLEKAMEKLPPERKALVDLIVVKSLDGKRALIPRSLVTKYPILLAFQSGDTISSVMPWTSKPKILTEGLPVDSYFLSDISQIELSNYREYYASLFLKRRTDPSAMRGEKIFLHNCTGCHAAPASGGHAVGMVGPGLIDLAGEGPSRRLSSVGHPQVKGSASVPKLVDRDRRAISTYLQAYKAEQSSSGGPAPVSTSLTKAPTSSSIPTSN